MVQPGALLEGKYEILDKIREGGMGAIYRVRHKLLEEIRVIKVMKPSVVADEDLRRRFVEEARTATRLKHPNICTIHDFAIDDSGMAYLVMEFIDGTSVSDLIKRQGTPPLPLALEIAHQSLLALGFLHRKGIVHRDVAPDNIMLTRDDQGDPVVKLIDLGIAKVTEAPVEATATGVFLGKLKYASPEQYGSLPRGQKLDGRSDLYGLGVVLYELLTGVLPFEGDTVVELLRAHVFNPPKPFSESDPQGRVPPELRDAVLKTLQKRREDRFASAEEFDRRILEIRGRHSSGADREVIRTALAKVRPSQEVRIEPVTPSAQSHMDNQFFANVSTPTPTWRTGENERTAVAPEPVSFAHTKTSAPSPESLVPTTPIPRAPERRFPVRLAGGIVAAAVLAAGVWLSTRRGGERVAAPAPAGVRVRDAEPTRAPPEAAPSGVPTVAAVAVSEPTSPPAPEPTERPAEATAAPAPTIARHPTTHVAAAPTSRPAPVVKVEPTRAAVAVASGTADLPRPTAFPAAPAPPPVAPAAPAPAPTVRPAPTESDRVRETIRLYESAQNALDPDLYVRVFPGVDRSRIESAFSSFRSQSVQFEIKKIEISPQGNTAQVFGHETRLAVPKAGNDQRVDADRVLHLERRGDAWVITSVR